MNVLSRLIILGLSILVILGGYGLGMLRFAHAEEQPSAQATESVKQLIARVSGKCGNTDRFGGGILFGIGTDRLYIATARHVVWCGAKQGEAEGIQVELRSMPGELMAAKLLSRTDPSLDLAVLVVSGIRDLGVPVEAIPFDQLGDSKVLRRGHALYFVGHPAGRYWETNIVPDRLSDKRGDNLYFQSTNIGVGASGGGLFDDQQKLVGMIIGDSPPESEAIAIEKVLAQFRFWGYPVSLQYKQSLRDISGEWLSEKLQREERYVFSFEMQGALVFGTANKVGNRARGILDGKIEDDIISFRIRDSGRSGSYFDTQFHGKIVGEEISFIRQVDTGAPPTKFIATSRGGTPLHKAVAKGHVENIRRILDSGVDIEAPDNFFDTVLHIALRRRLQTFTQNKTDEDATKWLAIITLLVEKGADANKANLENETPLQIVLALKPVDLETAKVLLAHGANPNQRAYGIAFLHRAACRGQVDVAEALILARADVDVVTEKIFCSRHAKHTPLQFAADKKNQEIVRLLIEAGADVNLRAPGDNAALHDAVSNRDEEMVRMLLRAGADVDGIGYSQSIPLLRALSLRTDTVAKLLLDAGADVTKRGKNGLGSLHRAVTRENAEDLIRRLLASGAAIDDRVKNGRTVLHFAASAGSEENVKLLLELGADVNARDKNENTPLHDAIYNSWRGTETVDLLLGAGVDVNAANENGNTPLHLVALTSTKKDVKESGFFPIAESLIGKGANVDAKNKRHETPFDIAAEQKGAIARVLRADRSNRPASP